jgi:hypothetical protein
MHVYVKKTNGVLLNCWAGKVGITLQNQTNSFDTDLTNKFVFYKLSAIIADFKFYADNENAIDSWLNDHWCSRTGMVVEFWDEQTMMLFILRWA